ncbi:site-specific integrase [Fulvivirga lutea]|uniref:Site-specific integrase n=1 Tax=Fulvivirga lutea TaxID=2810512 RepID=A0A975A2D4_9BACT|nr:site-specific integrase [Fulvivirga lutea]QSE99175.1 site-specific integrase [Fulvivirga lutea]
MSITLKYVLDTRSTKSNGDRPLKLRLIYNRSSAHISTGFYLSPKEWDDTKEMLKSSSKRVENVSRFNNELIKKKAELNDSIYDLLSKGFSHLTAAQLKEKAEKKTGNKQDSFFIFLKEQIEDLKEARRFGTADSYKSLYNKIKNFRNGDLTLRFHEIDYKFLSDLEKVHLNKGSNLGSLGVYMRTLRAVYNKAIKNGVAKLEDYPFKQYTIRKSDAKRTALSQVEVKKLIDSFFESKVLEDAKNYYLLSFFLQGMNWMDMCLLKGENISSDYERITYVRHKTGKRFSIKFFKQAKEIIENLSGRSISQIGKNEFVLPILNHEPDLIAAHRMANKRKKVNKALKKIGEELNIDHFTIYTARHTYATSLKRNGTPTAAIQEGLGHKTEEMTQTYLNSFGNEVLDKYNEEMFNDL